MRHGCRAKPQQRAIQESEQGRGSVAARGTTAERAEGSSAWEMRGADDKREEMRRELLQHVQATRERCPDAISMGDARENTRAMIVSGRGESCCRTYKPPGKDTPMQENRRLVDTISTCPRLCAANDVIERLSSSSEARKTYPMGEYGGKTSIQTRRSRKSVHEVHARGRILYLSQNIVQPCTLAPPLPYPARPRDAFAAERQG